MLDRLYQSMDSPVTMVILSVAIMLISGFLITRITKKLRLPNVTAYIVAGILIGHFVLKLVPRQVIEGTEFPADIALAFIAFSTGEFFKLSTIRINGMLVILITMAAALLGGAFGVIMKFTAGSKKRSADNRLIIVGALLFAFCGICAALDVSPLLGCMSMGMVYINVTDDEKKYKTHRQIIEALGTPEYVHHIEEMQGQSSPERLPS